MPAACDLFYFNLYGPDLTKSKFFYEKVFGWKVGGGSLGGHISNISTPGGIDPGGSTTAVFFVVEDLEAALVKVQEHGGKVVSRTIFDGIGPAAHCQNDHQGCSSTNFWLQEPGTDEMKHHVARDIKKGCRHGDLHFFTLPVLDMEKAVKFFGSVLDWHLEHIKKDDDEGYLMVTNLKGPDGRLVGPCDRTLSTGQSSSYYPSFWFRVDDIHRSISLVQKLGGKTDQVYKEPSGAVMCQCEDDQGVPFGIVQP